MENRAPYGDSERYKIREGCLKPFSAWETPTGEEIRAAMKLAGLTGAELANLVGVQSSRTVRRWTGNDVPIPYSAWAILCYRAGLGMIWETT